MNQLQIEHTLQPSEARALALARKAGGVNRFEANLTDGHCSLGQRISTLRSLGFQIIKQRETWIDTKGKKHSGVVRYFCLGWVDPATQAAA